MKVSTITINFDSTPGPLGPSPIIDGIQVEGFGQDGQPMNLQAINHPAGFEGPGAQPAIGLIAQSCSPTITKDCTNDYRLEGGMSIWINVQGLSNVDVQFSAVNPSLADVGDLWIASSLNGPKTFWNGVITNNPNNIPATNWVVVTGTEVVLRDISYTGQNDPPSIPEPGTFTLLFLAVGMCLFWTWIARKVWK
jgi:hypothetical protein